MLQGMLIGLEKEHLKIVQKHIQKLVPKIDNWAVCDVFCAGLKITKKHKNEMWDFIQKYLLSDKEFEIRFAVVMILDFFIEEHFIKRDLQIFDEIDCQAYYVQMAVAWAISICLIKFYDITIQYLENCNLDKFTYNKALQKAIESYRISDERKVILRSMKKA